MTAAVRVHGYPVSTWTRTACMTCIEKGIEYELVPVARGSAEHAALHPYLRMPILELAGGTTIFETLAICGHLDEAFPGPSLQPQGAAARARMRTWMGVCGDYLFTQVVQGIPRKRAPVFFVLEREQSRDHDQDGDRDARYPDQPVTTVAFFTPAAENVFDLQRRKSRLLVGDCE